MDDSGGRVFLSEIGLTLSAMEVVAEPAYNRRLQVCAENFVEETVVRDGVKCF